MRKAMFLHGLHGLSAALMISASAMAGVTQFEATLLGSNEVPPNASPGSGSATLTFDSGTNTLTVTSGSYSDLTTASTAAHVHIGAAGVNGGVVFGLTHSSATSGTLSGSGVLNASQVSALQSEGLYINVHTSSFPGGELRGQIVQPPPPPVTPVIKLVYSEIAGEPSSAAPGMLDLSGNPVAAKFDALFDIAISPDGTQWIIRADTDLPTTHDQVLLLGSGTKAMPLAQDGRPVPGSTTGELWDFFDSDYPASFNENGDIAFSGRARPSTSIKEKIIKVIGGVQTIFATESTPVTGLLDVPQNPTGDELIGNSVGSVSFLNDNQVFFGNTPIQNCHSSRYPALFLDTVGFAQSGVTAIGFETWDNFGFGDCGMAPNGKNWFALGDTENPDTSMDRIFAVNNEKIVQENTVIAGTSVIAADIFFVRMIADGTWFARGDDTAPDNDWALRGIGNVHELLAKTGDPIVTPLQGPSENWGAVFTAFHGNSNGDWVLTGNTTNADPLIDSVLVLNGTQVILRENDPVDVDGNGKFDDDAFIGNTNSGTLISGFHANDLLITDAGVIHAFVTLRNSANVILGDAYLQIDLNGPVEPCLGDADGDQDVDVDDLLAVINSWGPCVDCPADFDGDDDVDVDDLLTVINAWGGC